MDEVTLILADAPFLEADEQYPARVKFVFQIDDVSSDDDEQYIGREHWVFANMPAGKSGKLKSNSNMYKILEGLSGGEFDPGDEPDTDDYVGKKYVGDFKREQKQEMVSKGVFKPKFNDDGTPVKKTVLRNLRPLRPRSSRRSATAEVQSEHDWDKLPNAS
jgi:hypothetical protein